MTTRLAAGTRTRQHLIILAATAWLAVAGFAGPAGFFGPAGHAGAQTPPEPQSLFDALEASLTELPRERFELAALLTSITTALPDGSDRALAIFAWVRDETGLVPYRGVLKGPAGMVLDRTGNSLDRALLLRELLLAAGEEAVLATAELDAAATASVSAALRTAPAAAASLGDPAATTQVLAERMAAEFGADAQVVQERLLQVEHEQRALLAELQERTAAQSAALADLLADRLDASSGVDDAALLRDHWWVQIQRDGAWLDLDPTLPDAAAGETLVAATARFGPTSLSQLAAIDGACRDLTCGERLHSVVIRALSEKWDGSAYSEEELLSVELLPAELLGQTIAFAAVAEDWPEDLDLFETTQPAAELRAALTATEAWRPVLSVGGNNTAGIIVNDDGTTTTPGGGGGPGGLGGGVGGLFGGFGGGGGGSESELTALWLEFEVRVPGSEPATLRRALFDAAGPAARAAGEGPEQSGEALRLARATALAGETQLGLHPAALHPAAVSASAANRLLAEQDAWLELYYAGAGADPAVIQGRQNAMAALVSPLESFAVLSAETERSPALAGLYQNALSVILFHRGLDSELQPFSAFDLVHRPVAALGDGSAVTHGVADGNLEALLQRSRGGAATGEEARVNAVAEAFAADLASGRPWRLATTAAELDAFSPGLGADLRQRALDELARGKLIIAPESGADDGGAAGFWLVDPANATVLALGDRGWGQAMTSYAETTNVVLQLRTVINMYASIGQCLGIALTMPLRGETGVSEELAQCVFSLVCSQITTAVSSVLKIETDWTSVILSATIDALWGGVPEAGPSAGGLCGGLWKRLAGN